MTDIIDLTSNHGPKVYDFIDLTSNHGPNVYDLIDISKDQDETNTMFIEDDIESEMNGSETDAIEVEDPQEVKVLAQDPPGLYMDEDDDEDEDDEDEDDEELDAYRNGIFDSDEEVDDDDDEEVYDYDDEEVDDYDDEEVDDDYEYQIDIVLPLSMFPVGYHPTRYNCQIL